MRFKLTETTAKKRPNNYYSQFKGQNKPKKDIHNHLFNADLKYYTIT